MAQPDGRCCDPRKKGRRVSARLSWKGYRDNFAALRYEAEAELDRVAQKITAECNDESSWGGYFMHNSNDTYGPGRIIALMNPTSDRMDRLTGKVS